MSVRDIAIAAALVGCCQGATLAEIPGFPCYRTVEETYAAAEQIVADHPTLATWTDIGDSWEKSQGLGGYDLFALRLTNAAISTPKPKLVVTCTIHAREYPPAELCTRFAERLVEEYGRHPDVTWILDRHEIHLIPIGNPDGRKLAETGDLWRKNTNQNHCGPTSEFRGADLNRNFEFEWGCCGASGEEECSDYYRGPSPASEPETQAIQSYLRAQFPDQRGEALNDPAPASATGIYLDVHSAGKLVLWPWAFGPVPPNVSGLRTLGRKLAFFNGHLPKQFANLYLAEGTAIDFAYGDLGVAAYLFELGVLFFQDCATLEEEILPGNLEALLYAARVARLPYLTPAGPDAIEVEALPGFVDAGTPVTLSAIVTDERYSTLNGTEPAQNVASALAYAGSTPWDLGGGQPLAMSPLDGALDSPVESVEVAIDTTGMAAGPHLLYVRGQDAEGNVGPLGASFLWIRGGPEGGGRRQRHGAGQWTAPRCHRRGRPSRRGRHERCGGRRVRAFAARRRLGASRECPLPPRADASGGRDGRGGIERRLPARADRRRRRRRGRPARLRAGRCSALGRSDRTRQSEAHEGGGGQPAVGSTALTGIACGTELRPAAKRGPTDLRDRALSRERRGRPHGDRRGSSRTR